MKINIKNGEIQYIYNEDLNINDIGKVNIKRVSKVEPDKDGKWYVDLSLIGGEKINGFNKRSNAIKYEIDWIEKNIL